MCVNSFPTTVQVEEHLKLHSFSENAKEESILKEGGEKDKGKDGSPTIDIQCTMCKKDFPDKHGLRIHMQVDATVVCIKLCTGLQIPPGFSQVAFLDLSNP